MQLRRLATWAAVVGAVMAAVSSIAMIAATLSAPLALIGIAVQSGRFADTADRLAVPVLRPVLIGSLLLMVIGLAPRGRVLGLAVIGSALVYVATFVLPSGAAAMLEMGMSTTEPEPPGLVVFWLGVAIIAAAFVLAYRRAPAAVVSA